MAPFSDIMAKQVDVSNLWQSQREKQRDVTLVNPDGSEQLPAPARRYRLGALADVYSAIAKWPRFSERLLFFGGFGLQCVTSVSSALIISHTIRNRFYLSGKVAGLMSAYVAISVSVGATATANDSITVRNLFNPVDSMCFPCMQVSAIFPIHEIDQYRISSSF